jgi:hypothetical protein
MELVLQLKIGNRKYKRNFVYYSINKEIMSEVKLEKVTFEFTQEENCASNDMGGIELLTVEDRKSVV